MSKFATIDRSPAPSEGAVLRIIGVGGGGCNAINSMVSRGLSGVEYIAVNTDKQDLTASKADKQIQIGTKTARGLGAGADPAVGREAAEEDKNKLEEAIEGADMIFITAGMGGGTGTGAAPVIAEIAFSKGILVVAIVTKPFRWEGKKRNLNAEQGIMELKQHVDSLIIIPNDRLNSVLDKHSGITMAFDKPNEVLYEATKGISDIITVAGLVNLDINDVKTVMKASGIAIMGCGYASGENRAVEAAHKAISSPLLEDVSVRGAQNILLNVTCSHNMTMEEIEQGNSVIAEAAGDEVNIIFGVVINEDMNDYVSYTVIATGFEDGTYGSEQPKKPERKPKLYKKPQEEKESFAFWKNNNNIDEKNLEIPTIERVYKARSAESDINDLPETGFKFENTKDKSLDFYRDSTDDNMNEGEDDSEDEVSTFLRHIID